MATSIGPYSSCGFPNRDEQIAEFCLGDASLEDKQNFEAHLLNCAMCQEEVRRLHVVVWFMRRDDDFAKKQTVEAAADYLKLSSKADDFLGGHFWHALIASVLYATLYAMSLAIEVVYQLDKYGQQLWTAVPALFLWVAATSVITFYAVHRCAKNGSPKGLALGGLITIGSAVVAFLGAGQILPDEPIVQATFQTYSARAAFLKDAVYFLAVSIPLILLPFNFIVFIQREMKAGRYTSVSRIIRGSGIIGLRLTLYPKFRFACWVFALYTAYALYGMNHLLDNIVPNPNIGLFQRLMWIRMAVYLLLSVEVLSWYRLTLDRARRELTIVESIRSDARRNLTL